MFTRWISIVLAVLFVAASAQARVIEKVYGVVNGEIITLSEIKDYQKKLREGGFLNDLLFASQEIRDQALKNKDYLIKILVDEKIIDFYVKKNGLLITEERVSKEVSTIAKRQNLTVKQLKRTLQDQGVDYAEYRDFVKKSVERRQLVEKEITSKIKISEQDIISHYLSKNKTNKTQVFEFNIAHILLNRKDKEKAKEIVQKLEKGAAFESLVKANSVDSDTKNKNGVFGTFKSGEMIATIEKAIADLKIGETSQTVETPMGLHIFKVLDKKLVKDPAIEKQKQIIYQQLFAKEFKEQLEFWLLQKRKDAIIQINKT